MVMEYRFFASGFHLSMHQVIRLYLWQRRLQRLLECQSLYTEKLLLHSGLHIRIVENNLREKDYSFDYEKLPSRAMFKYKKAFIRNDGERYNAFLSRVVSGEVKLHADNVCPYELVEPYLETNWYWSNKSFFKDITPEEKETLNATWEAMPDFGGDENALAVIDTSGSMYCDGKPIPAAVALSLGLYFAELTRAFSVITS